MTQIEAQVLKCSQISHGTLTFLILMLTCGSARAEVVEWEQPNLDQWFYPANVAPGGRVLGPTFGFFDEPGTQTAPGRRGTTIVGFDTGLHVPTGLAPSRYAIESVQMTLTSAPGNGNIAYDPTYDATSDVTQGSDDPGHPIELYGLGFRDNYDNPYQKLGFGAVDYQPPEFEEGTSPYDSGTGAYNLFPLGDDGNGQLTDVSNSVSGGYNSLQEEPVDPWDTIPWAIGTVEGIDAAAEVPYETTFTFDVNLDLPYVVDYLQQSLADGALGFLVSSLHRAEAHTGNVTYPQWYMKEHPRGTASKLMIDVSILSSLEGDFDQDGTLGVDDVNLLSAEIAAGTNNSEFDLDNDAVVGQSDLTVWVKQLRETWIGDANLDGQFETSDLVLVLQSGKYESDSAAGWQEGDWNADLRFNTGDLVAALQDGGFEQGPLAAVAVPEPTYLSVLGTGFVVVALLRRLRRRVADARC